MRKFLVFAALAVLALMAPATALAHHGQNFQATCTTATVDLVGFNDYDKSHGAYWTVLIDGSPVASGRLAPESFAGSTGKIQATFKAPTDNARHTVTIKVAWRTGKYEPAGVTVSNCCPPKPCCTDGEPGPQGPAGPAGPPSESNTNTNVVERTVERVVVKERSCMSRRVFTFLVKRGHQPEGKRYRLIRVRSIRASETYAVAGKRQFKVTQRVVRVRGHRRVQVTVAPRYAAGVKAVPGQVFSTRVQVTLTNGKRYVLQRLRRLCMPADGDLNNPSALAPTTPSAST